MSRNGGRDKRQSLNRCEHVVRLGWYVASREGTLGPFFQYAEAHVVVQRLGNPVPRSSLVRSRLAMLK